MPTIQQNAIDSAIKSRDWEINGVSAARAFPRAQGKQAFDVAKQMLDSVPPGDTDAQCGVTISRALDGSYRVDGPTLMLNAARKSIAASVAVTA